MDKGKGKLLELDLESIEADSNEQSTSYEQDATDNPPDTDTDPEPDCSICLLPLWSTDGWDVAGNTVCSHLMHHQCLKIWLEESSSTCPLDRKEIVKLLIYDHVTKCVKSEEAVEKKTMAIPNYYLSNAGVNDDEDESLCRVCSRSNDPELLLLCDGCDDPYHTYCVGLDGVPSGDWFCVDCQELQSLASETERRRRAGTSSTSSSTNNRSQQLRRLLSRRSQHAHRTAATTFRSTGSSRSQRTHTRNITRNIRQRIWSRVADRAFGGLDNDAGQDYASLYASGPNLVQLNGGSWLNRATGEIIQSWQSYGSRVGDTIGGVKRRSEHDSDNSDRDYNEDSEGSGSRRRRGNSAWPREGNSSSGNDVDIWKQFERAKAIASRSTETNASAPSTSSSSIKRARRTPTPQESSSSSSRVPIQRSNSQSRIERSSSVPAQKPPSSLHRARSFQETKPVSPRVNVGNSSTVAASSSRLIPTTNTTSSSSSSTRNASQPPPQPQEPQINLKKRIYELLKPRLDTMFRAKTITSEQYKILGQEVTRTVYEEAKYLVRGKPEAEINQILDMKIGQMFLDAVERIVE